MGASFLTSASKKTTDIRGFLRDAAGSNSLKYAAEKGVKHLIYIPFKNVDEIDDEGNNKPVKQLVAISGAVHEWTSPEGKYKASVCIKDVVRKADDGTIMNDGSCPFCNRVEDAWNIYNYRKELEESACVLSGDDRKKHLEKTFSTFADERKCKNARDYVYILIVKFRTDAKAAVILGANGLPEYDLKVMKLSSGRVDKMQQQIENSGLTLAGCEMIISYPAMDDRRLVVSMSTTSPVFPGSSTIATYPGLENQIQNDISKFTWEGVEKSFSEWNGMTSSEADKIVAAQFEKWDEYKKELLINPSVKYLEYNCNANVANPSLGTIPTGAPVLPGSVPVIPGAVPADGTFGGSIPDANVIFGATPTPPTINI